MCVTENLDNPLHFAVVNFVLLRVQINVEKEIHLVCSFLSSPHSSSVFSKGRQMYLALVGNTFKGRPAVGRIPTCLQRCGEPS